MGRLNDKRLTKIAEIYYAGGNTSRDDRRDTSYCDVMYVSIIPLARTISGRDKSMPILLKNICCSCAANSSLVFHTFHIHGMRVISSV